MDVSATNGASLLPDPGGTPPEQRGAGRLLGDARAIAAALLLLSAAADTPSSGTLQLRRLVELLNPCLDPADEKGSMLRQVYGAVDDLRRLVE